MNRGPTRVSNPVNTDQVDASTEQFLRRDMKRDRASRNPKFVTPKINEQVDSLVVGLNSPRAAEPTSQRAFRP